VRAVHRIARLEGHHSAPAEPGEIGTHLGRRFAQLDEVVVRGQAQALDAAADRPVVGAFEQVRDAGVGAVERAVDGRGLALAVVLPDLFDFEQRECST